MKKFPKDCMEIYHFHLNIHIHLVISSILWNWWHVQLTYFSASILTNTTVYVKNVLLTRVEIIHTLTFNETLPQCGSLWVPHRDPTQNIWSHSNAMTGCHAAEWLCHSSGMLTINYCRFLLQVLTGPALTAHTGLMSLLCSATQTYVKQKQK